MNAETSGSAGRPPDDGRPEKGARSALKHPLILALVPAVTAVVVAVITVTSGGRSSSPPAETTPPTRDAEIAYRIERDLNEYSDGWQAAFADRLPETTQLPQDGKYTSLIQWAAARGAVDVGDSYLRIYVQNNGSERVTIRSIQAVVVERLQPMSKVLVHAPSAGLNEVASLDFDLDKADEVRAMHAPDPEKPSVVEDFFARNNVSLDPGESIDLGLHVSATTCHCRYRFAFEILKGTSTLTLEVSDQSGRPFQITGPTTPYAERFTDGGLACSKKGLFRTPVDSRSPDCSRSV